MTRGRLLVVWLASFALFLPFFLLLSTLPLFLRRLGTSDGAIGVIMGSFAITSMLLRPWTGWAADRWGRRPFMLAGAAVFSLAPLGYDVAGGVLALAAVRMLHGAGMALYPTAATALVADVAPPARRGEFLGLFSAAGSIAMAIGPLTGVALMNRAGFTGLFGAAATTALVALLLTLATPETLGAASRAPFTVASILHHAGAGDRDRRHRLWAGGCALGLREHVPRRRRRCAGRRRPRAGRPASAPARAQRGVSRRRKSTALRCSS